MEALRADYDSMKDQLAKCRAHLEEMDAKLKTVSSDVQSIKEQLAQSRKRKAPDSATTDDNDNDTQDTQPLTQEEDTKDKPAADTMTEIVEDLVELGKDVVKHFVGS
jgi:predicted  nucleic acid-binding Zn-ribbon protein